MMRKVCHSDVKSIVQVFSSALNQQIINVVVWSPCGKFLAAGTVGGTLSVWDVEAKLCIERYSDGWGLHVLQLRRGSRHVLTR